MQVQAISIMNALMGGPAAEALSANISSLYREGLFRLARDTSSEVRRGVCSGIILLLTLQPEAVTSEFSSIVEYMLLSCQVPQHVLLKFQHISPRAEGGGGGSDGGAGQSLQMSI